MKLMDHLHWEDIDDENLDFFKAIGVDCLLAHLPGELADGRDPTGLPSSSDARRTFPRYE